MSYYSIHKVQKMLDAVEFTVEYDAAKDLYCVYSSVLPNVKVYDKDPKKASADCLYMTESYIYSLADYHNGRCQN